MVNEDRNSPFFEQKRQAYRNYQHATVARGQKAIIEEYLNVLREATDLVATAPPLMHIRPLIAGLREQPGIPTDPLQDTKKRADILKKAGIANNASTKIYFCEGDVSFGGPGENGSRFEEKTRYYLIYPADDRFITLTDVVETKTKGGEVLSSRSSQWVQKGNDIHIMAENGKQKFTRKFHRGEESLIIDQATETIPTQGKKPERTTEPSKTIPLKDLQKKGEEAGEEEARKKMELNKQGNAAHGLPDQVNLPHAPAGKNPGQKK